MKITINMFIFFVSIVVTAIAIACNKDDNDGTSTEQFLTTPDCWKVVKFEGLDVSSNVWVEDENFIPDCDKDNCQKYNSDKTTTIDQGPTKCNIDDPQSYSGTWSLSDDSKKLTTNFFSYEVTGDIVEINSGKLVIESALFGNKIRTTLQPQ